MEEDKMANVSSTVLAGKITPPAIHLSPSRQSSSSTDHESKVNTGGIGLTVAKKKRELFSARSSRSGGSNQSSTSEYSREHSFSSKVLLNMSKYIICINIKTRKSLSISNAAL